MLLKRQKLILPDNDIEDNISIESDLIRTFDWHNANHLLDFITLQYNGRIRQVEALNLVKYHLGINSRFIRFSEFDVFMARGKIC